MASKTTLVRSCTLLFLLAIVWYAPGITRLPPTDRDEARFAQASKQMLETRDFVRIRFQDSPRNKKPIGIYWLQAASVYLLKKGPASEIWPYRIPSLLGATVAVLATYILGLYLFGQQTALLGAILLECSLLLVVEAHIATTDACLLACSCVAQGALCHLYLNKQKAVKVALLFWIAEALGILIKGPVVPMITGATILGLFIFDRDLSFLRNSQPALGIPLALALVTPWAIAIGIATDGRFFIDAIKLDIFPKLISGQESHGFPPGYYLLLMMLSFWPGSLYVWQGFFQAWQNRFPRSERFCLAWIIPNWIIFELIPTKLPHYVLPVYPALALITANAILKKDITPRSFFVRLHLAAWAITSITMALGTALLSILAFHHFRPIATIPLVAGLIVSPLAVLNAFHNKPLRATVIALICSLLIVGPTLQVILPEADFLWLSRSVARFVKQYTRYHPEISPLITSVGYHEPSLVFLLGTKTKLLNAKKATFYLREHLNTLVLVSNRKDPAFRKWLNNLHLNVTTLRVFKGFNYSKGRHVILKLYRVNLKSLTSL